MTLVFDCSHHQMCVFTVQSRPCLNKCLRSLIRLFASLLIVSLFCPLMIPQVGSLRDHIFTHGGAASKPIGVAWCCSTHTCISDSGRIDFDLNPCLDRKSIGFWGYFGGAMLAKHSCFVHTFSIHDAFLLCICNKCSE